MMMNTSIRRLFFVSALMFISLLGTLAYWQVLEARGLEDNPQNTRKVFAQMRIDRGLILARDRSELAANNKIGDLYYRTYPKSDLAPQLIGYSDATYGQVGLEHSWNNYLSGTADEVELAQMLDTITGKQKRGGDLKLTLDPKVQKTALDELEKLGKQGAVVVLDVKTGAVVAMVSTPTYDPNQLDDNWAQLNADPGAPLLNRATQGLYTPGSSFKLITTAAALENGYSPDSKFKDDKGSIEIYGNTVNNWRDTPFGNHDLTEAFSQSINTTFAQIGDKLGQDKLIEYQKRFGLWEKPPFELPADEMMPSGRYENGKLASPDDHLDPVQTVWMAIGQENVQVTPLQMAMIGQAIANGGKEMKPFVVDSVSDYNGTILKQAKPEELGEPIRPETAALMNKMMVKTVNDGTGSGAASKQVQIAGKTGTAEVDGRGPNAWFVGFAPANDPRYAIAVVVADADVHGHDSSPIARETLLAALGLTAGY